MATLHDLILRYPEPISKSIDLAFDLTSDTGARYKMGHPDPALSRFIPMKRYISPKLALLKIEQFKPTLAYIVGVDGEYPVKKEPVEMNIELVGSTKLARAYVFTEKDYDMLRDAELHLRANEAQIYAELVKHYLQIPAYLTQTIIFLANVLALQLFTAGAATYVDPETKLGFELSYSSQIPTANTPLALTGTALWSDQANATPLDNLVTHLNAYYGEVYRLPESIVMPASVADAMLTANDTRLKVASLKGQLFDATAVANMARPTVDECLQWIKQNLTVATRNYPMPEIIISDAVYYHFDPNDINTKTEYRYTPADSYFFMNQGIVEGAFVPTATNDYASSFAVVTEWLSRAPRREKISIDTRYMALCSDPRYLGWRKVV